MMKNTLMVLGLILVFACFVAAEVDKKEGKGKLKSTLDGYEQVPAVSTPATGDFSAKISPDEMSIEYELSYSGLEGTPSAAHLHFGEEGVAGGIVVTLCGGTAPACPVSPGTLTGTITAAEVVPDATAQSQGIQAGEFAELLNALRAGAIYVNVHTDLYPSGEIRGQIGSGRKRGAGGSTTD